MAHRKAGGSTRLGRDSISKRLGVKVFGDQLIKSGEIIVRQRGTKFHPGENTRKGEDDTIYATTAGVVHFLKKKMKNYTGRLVYRQFVSVKTQEKSSK